MRGFEDAEARERAKRGDDDGGALYIYVKLLAL